MKIFSVNRSKEEQHDIRKLGDKCYY